MIYNGYEGYLSNGKRLYGRAININIGHSNTFTRCLMVPRRGMEHYRGNVPRRVCSVFSPFNGTIRATLSFGLINRSILVANTNPVNVVTTSMYGFMNTESIIVASVGSSHLRLTGRLNMGCAIGATGRSLSGIVGRVNVGRNFSVKLRVSNDTVTLGAVVSRVARNNGVTLLKVLDGSDGIS